MIPPTPEQAARCDALAKKIAKFDPDWALPGMAAHHERGGRWRLTGGEGRWLQEVGWKWHSANQVPADSDLRAAIANGPDWRDQATLGAILLSLGDDFALCFSDDCARPWSVQFTDPDVSYIGHYDTNADAILAAKIAQLEAK